MNIMQLALLKAKIVTKTDIERSKRSMRTNKIKSKVEADYVKSIEEAIERSLDNEEIRQELEYFRKGNGKLVTIN